MSDLFDAAGQPRYWWSQLVAVPGRGSGLEYERLKRVWFDQTGCRTTFREATNEVHLVCTLFENMVLFDPAVWVPEFLAQAGIDARGGPVSATRWSYEFEDGESKRIADIVICARDAEGEFLVVIEAKRPGGKLKAGDADPAYYLNLRPFQRYARRWLVFLVGAGEMVAVRAQVSSADGARSGFISWEQLAAMQIMLARRMDAPDVQRNFMAGAIQYQFCQHGIRPATLAFPYLAKELPYEQMPQSVREGGQSTPERQEPLWRCDWGT